MNFDAKEALEDIKEIISFEKILTTNPKFDNLSNNEWHKELLEIQEKISFNYIDLFMKVCNEGLNKEQFLEKRNALVFNFDFYKFLCKLNDFYLFNIEFISEDKELFYNINNVLKSAKDTFNEFAAGKCKETPESILSLEKILKSKNEKLKNQISSILNKRYKHMYYSETIKKKAELNKKTEGLIFYSKIYEELEEYVFHYELKEKIAFDKASLRLANFSMFIGIAGVFVGIIGIICSFLGK